ncbi:MULTISPECIES: hypothetical protein [unclassified Sphingopyxis]|jgi:uncharacterized membrane protein YidH (DUF202 family)|nr:MULTISPECIES: hypothetical protein [unclassified Sphingopyxis]MDR6834864.1 uncharacterized membrane protein YidH (DUF202 family) [Sphingopyxis sp. BE122]MDR7227135.1 uncharacterized membrane protein YidH (DUF202 family) [Sphingopyxis sp. BE259]
MTDEPKLEPFDEAEYRRRQRSRANMMAWMLGGLAILFFFITIAKIQIFA